MYVLLHQITKYIDQLWQTIDLKAQEIIDIPKWARDRKVMQPYEGLVHVRSHLVLVAFSERNH